MHRHLHLLLALVVIVGIRPATAPAASATANAVPAAEAKAAPIATTEIAAQSESTLSSIRAIEGESTSDPSITAIEQQLPAVTEEIGARSEENARILTHSTSLELFGRLENSWRGISEELGDVIQLDNTEGVVKRIGIRASIVRTSNGSEIIVPNAKLISDPVTNWTFSQRRRLISMPVAVASEIEPRKVMDVLRRVAGGHPLVAKDGPVQTLLTNLNNGTASYELRAWTDQSENWEQVRSDLFILVKASLANEGIPMR